MILFLWAQDWRIYKTVQQQILLNLIKELQLQENISSHLHPIWQLQVLMQLEVTHLLKFTE